MLLLEECIMQKDHTATAGSKILENFTAPFDATVVSRLNDAGIAIDGRITLAEFALGDTAEIPDNATILCNDVFGVYRKQAAKQGLFYIHPTYGRVSRFGLIPLVCSMDQIGIICQNPDEGMELLSVIAGYDKNDGAMPMDMISCGDKKDTHKIIELEYDKIYPITADILRYAEMSNNISRYDGIKFGYRTENFKGLNDVYVNTRSEGFGVETKLAAIMGTLVLSKDYYNRYYEKAMKVRRMIKESLTFDKYDIIIQPVESPLAMLAGLPSVTFKNYQLIANTGCEAMLLSAYKEVASR